MAAMEIGEYGTEYKPETFRCTVRILNSEFWILNKQTRIGLKPPEVNIFQNDNCCFLSVSCSWICVIMNLLLHEIHVFIMPRKILTESIKRLTVELPESEYKLLEDYCLKRQQSKRQVIRYLISELKDL